MPTDIGTKITHVYTAVADLAAACHLSENELPDTPDAGDLAAAINRLADVLERHPRLPDQTGGGGSPYPRRPPLTGRRPQWTR